nr:MULTISPECIES: C40 family peptidase [unclassified Streptomyces]
MAAHRPTRRSPLDTSATPPAPATRAASDRLRAEATCGTRHPDEARRSRHPAPAGPRSRCPALAAAPYLRLAPAVRQALTVHPDGLPERAALAERADAPQATAVRAVQREPATIRRLRTESTQHLTAPRRDEMEPQHRKALALGKLTEARTLLDRLAAEERARYEPTEASPLGTRSSPTGTSTGTVGAGPSRGDGHLPVPAPNERAAQAIAFAYAQLGKPYVWGATGPSAYDCSGLTRAAWRSAGVSLPRTTYSQINAGRRVPLFELAPGDLVFFYSGISHVGLYIGNDRMIHAPRPGTPVRIAPITDMPFAGATRVA